MAYHVREAPMSVNILCNWIESLHIFCTRAAARGGAAAGTGMFFFFFCVPRAEASKLALNYVRSVGREGGRGRQV